MTVVHERLAGRGDIAAQLDHIDYAVKKIGVDHVSIGTDTAWVRAERAGTPRLPGDGRVYHIGFTATDAEGGTCSGTVPVCVPHDQRPGATCVDQGPLHDSTICQ